MRLFHLPSGKKLWAVIATAILGTTLGTITLTQGTASAAPTNCTQAHVVCFFQTADYRGTVARYDFTKQNGKINIAWINNNVSSVYINYSGKYVSVKLYDLANCNPGGASGPTISNVGNYPRVIPNLAAAPYRFDNRATCARIDY
jgi:hypothetical protein